MAARKPSAADLLDLIASRAQRLRDAGVTSVEFDGCSFTLSPAQVADAIGAMQEDPPDDDPDPLRNPSLYADGKVPGFTRGDPKDGAS